MRILCPTDLSEHSLLALDYAILLHNAMGGELHIITTYTIKRTSGSMINIDEQVMANTKEDLQEVVDKYAPKIKTGNTIKTDVIPGDAATVIMAYAARHKMHFIVMGTQGSNSLRTLLFGSVTRKVSQHSSVPVIAIPNEALDSHLGGEILMAADDQPVHNVEGLDALINLASVLGKRINIVHVDTDEDGFRNQQLLDRVQNLLGTVTVHPGKNPVKELKLIAEERKVSLLVMIRREKSFMQRLLLKGNTASEVGEIYVPLLVIGEQG